MKIIDVSTATEEQYFGCLYSSPEKWKDWIAGIECKRDCYTSLQKKGLRVKLALDDEGIPRGMIQYAPAELNFVSVENMYFIHCMYIPKQDQGRNFRRTGMGKALLQAAEEDVRTRGADAMIAWGISLPFWMKASYYKKQGYSKADKSGMAVLMWKPFTRNASKPSWDRPKNIPAIIPGKVAITAFNLGVCTLQNAHGELTKQVAAEFGDKVIFRKINTANRENLERWAISEAIYIDGKEMITGPPMNRSQIRKKIALKVKHLNHN